MAPAAACTPAAESMFGRDTNDTISRVTWWFSMSRAAAPPTPLATRHRSFAPCSAAAASKLLGTPELRPKPEIEIDAPSGMSATASAGEAHHLIHTSAMLGGGYTLGTAMEPTFSMPAEQAAEALMASMKLNGIDRLWFTSGTELAFFQEVPVKHQALGRPTPTIMTMTHENAALAAAMGETMITGRPSATAAHVECGMINAGGSIHNADRGHYPVLMMSGYPPSAETGSVPGARDAGIQWFQQVRDQGELVRQYMRWDHKLASYDNPGTVITRAVQVMMSEPQGPAYLAIPREAAMRPIDGARFPLARPTAARRASRSPIERCCARPRSGCSKPSGRSSASRVSGAIRRPCRRWSSWPRRSARQVIADGYRVNIPADHPLAVPGRRVRRPAAGCGLLSRAGHAGAVADDHVSPGRQRCKIITLAIDPIHRMTPIYEFPTDLAIGGDAGPSIPLLLEEVRSAMTPAQRDRCAAAS